MKCSKCGSTEHATDACTVKAPEPAAGGGPEVVVHEKDLLGAIHEMREAVSQFEEGTADRLAAVEKGAADLSARLAEDRTSLDNIETVVLDLQDKKQAEEKAFWDGVGAEVHNQAIATSWGYGVVGAGPIARAMYQPITRYNRPMAVQKVDRSYDLPEVLMQMNDFLHLWGLERTFKETGSWNGEHYRKVVKESDTYAILTAELAQFDRSFAKALDTSTTGSGVEWIPTQFSAQFIDDYRLLLRAAALFPRLSIPGGTGDIKVPRQGSRKRAYLQSEASGDSPTDISSITPGTGNVTFSAKKHAALVRWSDEVDEDSSVAIAPIVLAELAQAIADGEEDAVINGDNATTHQDNDVVAADDIRKSWDGLRLHAGGSSGVAAVDISTLSTANLRNIRKALGRYGAMSSDLAYITGVSGYVQLLGLTEVLTADLYTPQAATVIQGELARFDGSPVVVSEFIREDLTTAGIYDGATTTDTIILLVNTRSFWLADKGAPKSETARDIRKGQSYSVASRRIDFQQTQNPSASEETVGLGYSLTS